MSQVIILPNNIVEPFSQIGLPLCAEKAKTQIERYTQEVAMVAVILSDNYMKDLYENTVSSFTMSGYMACIDVLHQWAVEYVTKFAHVPEWEQFLSTDRTYGECLCWDDHVVAFGKTKLNKL